MSLFSGITFSDKARALASGGSTQSAPGTSDAPNSTGATTTAKQSSAALKFAPRISKQGKPTQRTTYSGSATTYASGSGEGLRGAVGLGGGGSAETNTTSQSEREKGSDEVVLGPDGKPLARAPAMTLAAADKSSKRDQAGEGQKRRKKKKRRYFVSHNFDPEEEYDPNRPNDLGEYQAFRKRVREERLAHARAKRRGDDDDKYESSYYSDSSEEAPRRDAPKLFAPPKAYSPPPPTSAPSAQVISGEDAYARRLAMSQNKPPPPSETGEEAYARRLAMSQGQSQTFTSTQSGDDAYARRVALSQSSGSSQPPPPDTDNFPPPDTQVPMPPDELAPPPPTTSEFVPPPAHLLVAVPKSTPFQPPPPHLVASAPGMPQLIQPPPAHLTIGAPSFWPSAQSPPQGPTPSFQTQPTQPAETNPKGPDFATILEEKRKAAAAIAAKYAHLAANPTPAPTPTPLSTTSAPPPPQPVAKDGDDQSGTFAEKMFRKWGHVEGTGLGVRGEGIVHALQAEHVQSQTDSSKPLSKRALAKQKAAAANAKTRKWVQAPNARGRIVNINEEEKQKEMRGKFGEESRIVCLTQIVGGLDEVDEEITDEIGTECSNFGYVERVVLHMVEPPPPDPADCLRVFVVFSGMAGAWRAVKELNGRFFGGRKISAKYYDEKRFDAGDRDGDI